jgi:hypothetical protein
MLNAKKIDRCLLVFVHEMKAQPKEQKWSKMSDCLTFRHRFDLPIVFIDKLVDFKVQFFIRQFYRPF